jgi:hypothetical protein
MKKNVTKIIMVLALALNLNALTSEDVSRAGFDKLSDAQKIEIMQQVNQKANTVVTTTTATKVNEWVNVGTNIGKGLAGAAKEVGVAVNDFAKTDVGQLTMYLIVWNIMGSAIVHIIGGLMIWFIGLIFIIFYYSKARTKSEYKKDGQQIIEYNLDSGVRGELLFIAFIVMIAGSIAIFTF